MKITQVKDLVNNAIKETDGSSTLLKEDLSNVVDVGSEIFGADSVDNFVKKLVDRVGYTVFNSRVYQGSIPSILMSSWEFGSVMEKVETEIPTSTENDSWNLQDGHTYSQDTFYQPKVSAKFYNSRVTFDIPLSFTEMQVKSAFNSANELNSFISMLVTSVQNAMTVNIDNLITRTINNMTAFTLNGKNANRAVNLLTVYNTKTGEKLTAAKALTDSNFIKFANQQIMLTQGRFSKLSTLFNEGGKQRFTPKNEQHLVLLDDFASASKVYLESDTYHDSNVSLQGYETVPYWQGSGTSYDFADTSKIDVSITVSNKPTEIVQSGIIGVLFDTNAVGVSCMNQRVTSAYNARAEFYTNFTKFDAGFFNDLNENFVVFYIADAA
jgi:hypothetical protein